MPVHVVACACRNPYMQLELLYACALFVEYLLLFIIVLDHSLFWLLGIVAAVLVSKVAGGEPCQCST